MSRHLNVRKSTMLVVLLVSFIFLVACRGATVTPVAVIAPSVAAETPVPLSTNMPATAVAIAPTEPFTFTYRILNSYPHDPQAFTQGLLFDDKGIMLEGTGQWGQSSLREVDWQSGNVLRQVPLPDQYFGEGITLFDDRIIQLTWQSQTGFVYDRDTFELLQQFNYPTEGWGITHDGQRLIMSDGTATIYFWDPQTLKEIGRINVFDENGPVVRLNELEYVDGELWANIWQTDMVARIDLETGQLLGWIDLTGLLSAEMRSGTENVLNGIAVDGRNGRIYVTGKYWPTLFEIELVPITD